MRRVPVLLCFCSCISASSQSTVSEFCRSQKTLYDSAMYHEYGDLFFQYFVFDEESTASTDPNHCYSWNDTMSCDSILAFSFGYYFSFTGARIDSGTVYSPVIDKYGRLVTNSESYPLICSTPCLEKCRYIGEKDMDSLTRKYLGKPLGKCTVNLYPFNFCCDSDTGFADLDCSHAYFEVRYERYRGSTKRAKRFTITSWTMLVDATTGEVVGPVEKDKLTGTVGRF
jgi:hypothetical protein